MNYGLIPKPRDPRRFKHAQHFGSLPLDQIPKTLGRKPYAIEDQALTQFCTAFCTSTAGEFIEKEDMSPEFQAAAISDIAGEPITNGATAADALASGILFGFLPKSQSPFKLGRDPIENWIDINKWPQELRDAARMRRMGSYFDPTDGPYDWFDNMRAAMTLARQAGEERVCMVFSQWFSNWQGKNTFRRGTGSYSWHAHIFMDWIEKDGELVMVEQNSYGEDFGTGGISYWSREAVNQLMENPNNDIQMYRDANPADVKREQWTLTLIIYNWLVKIEPKAAGNWLSNLYRIIFLNV